MLMLEWMYGNKTNVYVPEICSKFLYSHNELKILISFWNLNLYCVAKGHMS